MNCASNQLLSRSGLSQNQDRGIRRSYLRNLDQHVAQWLRGTDDFLEHGRAYDVFPQRNVFVSCPVFGALAVIDIGSSYIPAHQTSLFVVERVGTEEEPAILTVLPECSLLDFKRQAASQTCFALLAHPLEIFRMVRSGAKVRGDHVLHGEAGIVEHCLVRVERLALRVQDDNGLRYSIGNPAKLPLLLKEFLLRPFSIFDVSIASKPPDDVAFSVELWNDTYQEPTVLSVISPDASFQFAWLGSIQQGSPFTNELIQVIGVNDHLPTPTFPLLQGQAGVLVPAFVQIFLGSVREARPQERRNRVDDSLKPGSLLAELFESVTQLVAFRILGKFTHRRFVHRGVRTMLAVLETATHAEFSANAEITA